MRGMNKASKRLRAFTAGVGRSMRRVATFGAALTAVAVGALVLMTRNAFKAIDATAKLAFTLGLATEQLTGYQFAAAISGVSSEQLATAFKRMSKNISDAADAGLSTAIRAFEDLGLSAEGLKKLSPDKQFKKIADRLAGMTDQAKKVRVALDLFGRSGLGLLKLTQDGAKGIAKLQKEAQKLGLTYNEIDASKIEAANDAITRARTAIQGIVNQLAIRISFLVEAMADGFTNWATAGVGAANRVKTAFGGVVTVFGAVADFVEVLEFKFLKLKQLDALGQAVISDPLGVARGKRLPAVIALQDQIDALQKRDPPSVRLRKRLEELSRKAEAAANAAAAGGKATGAGSLLSGAGGRVGQFASGQRELQAAGGGQLDVLNRIAASEEENTRLLRQMARAPAIAFT